MVFKVVLLVWSFPEHGDGNLIAWNSLSYSSDVKLLICQSAEEFQGYHRHHR